MLSSKRKIQSSTDSLVDSAVKSPVVSLLHSLERSIPAAGYTTATSPCELKIHRNGVLPKEYYFSPKKELAMHYRQSGDWYSFHKEECCVAGSFFENRLVARSIIKINDLPLGLGKIFRIERGPAAVNSAFLLEHIGALAKQIGGDKGVIEINPYLEDVKIIAKIDKALKHEGWKPVEGTRNFYRNTVIVDLTCGLDEIQSGFRKSLRRNIKKAIKLGLRSEIRSSTDFVDQLIVLFNEIANKRGFEAIHTRDRDYIVDQVENGRVAICALFLGSDFVGGNIIVPFDQRVLLEWGAFSDLPEHRKYPLAHLADWESIKWAKGKGYKALDFSGYWLDRGDEDPINHYKAGFCKSITTVMPEYDYYTGNRAHRALIQAARYGRKSLIQVRQWFR